MKPRHPRIFALLRAFAALAVFAAALSLFVSAGTRNSVLARWQFGPAFSGTVSAIAAGGLAIGIGMLAVMLTVLIVTLLFGRWYCAVWCPFGILQNGILQIRRWILRKRFRFQYRRDCGAWRLGIFLACAGLLAGGVVFPYACLEPFTNFGRVAGGVGRPVAVWLQNLSTPDDPAYLNMNWQTMFWIGLILLALLTVLTVWRGRLFCNLLCPVGAILHRCGKYSIFGYRLDAAQCVHCGQCAARCPAECVNPEGDGIDAGRCVVCGQCAAVCPVGAISYRPGRAASAPAEHAGDRIDENRRGLLAAGAMLPLGVLGGVALGPVRQRATPSPILPPGAGSLQNFTARCTGCQLCVAHCTGEVLRPNAAGQIELFYGAAMCEFDCNNCSQVCPSGAIRPLSLAAKQRTRIGMVAYTETLCIAAVDGTACGACAEHCPTGALTMVKGPRQAEIPKPISDLCIGCGNCQYACPVRPVRAIVVEPIPIQVQAADPAAFKKSPQKTPAADGGGWAF